MAKNPLRGQDRRVVSTKLYRVEYAPFMKICENEKKRVNGKLREMILREIENSNISNKDIFTKKKEDIERGYDKIKRAFDIEVQSKKKK